jgi:hypothetical protein
VIDEGGWMQRWEIKHQWIPVDLKKSELSTTEHAVNIGFEPTWKDAFNKAWAEAESLGNDGWELVSAVSETAARMTVGEKSGSSFVGGVSYTAGYMLLFRRPRA